MLRQSFSTGTPWEKVVAYSRAVRVGSQVFVSGTTASNVDGATVASGDAYEQTVFILQKIESALAEVGATLGDVPRTNDEGTPEFSMGLSDSSQRSADSVIGGGCPTGRSFPVFRS